jgi:hypothetical protein
MNGYADDVLEADGIIYQSIDESSSEGKEYLEAIQQEAVQSLEYFLKPSELSPLWHAGVTETKNTATLSSSKIFSAS